MKIAKILESLDLLESLTLFRLLVHDCVRIYTDLNATPQSSLHPRTDTPPATKIPPIEEMPQWMRDLARSPWSPILSPTLLYAIFMHGFRDGLLVLLIWYSTVFITIAHFSLYHDIIKALSDNLPVYCPESREISQAYFDKGQSDMYVLAVFAADKCMVLTLCLMWQGEFLYAMSFRKCLYGSAAFNIVHELVASGFLIRRSLHVNLGFWRDYWTMVKKQEEAVKADDLTASPAQLKARRWRGSKQKTKPIHELPAHLGLAQHPYLGGSPANKPPVKEQSLTDQPKPKRSARKKARPEVCVGGGKTEVGWDFLRH